MYLNLNLNIIDNKLTHKLNYNAFNKFSLVNTKYIPN